MTTNAFATVVGNSLLCTVPDTDWHFFIRTLDGKTYVPFSTFHKKTISPADVAKNYLPNWKTLHWTRIKNSILGTHESYANDIEFEINVYTTESSPKKHEEVVETFLKFMCSV